MKFCKLVTLWPLLVLFIGCANSAPPTGSSADSDPVAAPGERQSREPVAVDESSMQFLESLAKSWNVEQETASKSR